MSLGGGSFLTQNKKLPGSYINFISAAKATAKLSERGYAAMALELDWGEDGKIFTVEVADFEKECKKIFGYDYSNEKLKYLRDLFLNVKTLYAYRLNSGEKAKNEFALAKNSGTRGNDITIIVKNNIDDEEAFDVTTTFDGETVDAQTVKSAEDLNENDYVSFNKKATLTPTAGMPLTGGTNGEVTGASHQKFLDAAESYRFNTLGCASLDETTKSLYAAYTKRLRDENGIKFQLAVYDKPANYEGVINVKNPINEGLESGLVFWVTGASAACNINASNSNKKYDGELDVFTDYKQSELEKAIDNGEFVMHKVGEEIRVLDDVNSFTEISKDKTEDFCLNQVIRVLDQIGNDIAVLFNERHIGKTQNNDAGRMALWNDIVTYNRELEGLQAIEEYDPSETKVEKGADKKSVKVTNPVKPVAAMSKLYMTVIVA